MRDNTIEPDYAHFFNERKEKYMKNLKCVLCNLPLGDPHGNNAEPAATGRCCNECNATTVIPMRILQLRGGQNA